DDVPGTWDLQTDLQVTYGNFRFRETVLLETGQTVTVRSDVRTIAAEPQLQLDIPIPWIPGLRVSPLGAFGFGTTFSSSAQAELDGVTRPVSTDDGAFYTYQIGVSSVYEHRWEELVIAFGNAFVYAGNANFSGDEDVTEGYGTFRTGVEARHPLGFRI